MKDAMRYLTPCVVALCACQTAPAPSARAHEPAGVAQTRAEEATPREDAVSGSEPAGASAPSFAPPPAATQLEDAPRFTDDALGRWDTGTEDLGAVTSHLAGRFHDEGCEVTLSSERFAAIACSPEYDTRVYLATRGEGAAWTVRRLPTVMTNRVLERCTFEVTSAAFQPLHSVDADTLVWQIELETELTSEGFIDVCDDDGCSSGRSGIDTTSTRRETLHLALNPGDDAHVLALTGDEYERLFTTDEGEGAVITHDASTTRSRSLRYVGNGFVESRTTEINMRDGKPRGGAKSWTSRESFARASADSILCTM